MASSSNGLTGYAPAVPDHRLVRRIGKGAYGEVWLARSVTGVLRAVKIVRRDDFEDDRTFEREFEGIREYEPVSRNHRGLVHVLHIGRNDDDGFYYYVMELGDDVQGGPATNEIEYEPRTLRSDVLRKTRLPVAECLKIGQVLADALGYLHGQGLTHRDIKPSNVIFVGGIPKLADIGLVARSGQRTFVGTQGFTPPEGPGSPQADVYSLGMVLYEISTGKDRLDFPEVPDTLPDGERADWRKLNDVVCRACDPEANRRHSDGSAVSDDLAALLAGRTAPSTRTRWRNPALAVAALITIVATTMMFWPTRPPVPAAGAPVTRAVTPPPPTNGSIKISTTPQGADIMLDGKVIGTTPHTETNLPPGKLRISLTREGYRTRVVEADILAGQMAVVADELEFYQPPVPGKPWTNQLGMEFSPSGRNHSGTSPVTWQQFKQFAESEGKDASFSSVTWQAAGGKESKIVLATPETAERFCAWLLQRGRNLGFLGPEHYYTYARNDAVPSRKNAAGIEQIPFVCSVRSFLYGALELHSQPEGADVFELPSHRFLGRTPLVLPRMLPGRQSFEFRLEGHENHEIAVAVKAEETQRIDARMLASRGVVFSKPWDNSLGMRLVPAHGLLVASWETRLADWQAYRAATGAPAPSASFRQQPAEPVAGVSRKDAIGFCKWLTDTERASGLLQENHQYRLPKDAEWSRFAGLIEPPNKVPHQLDGLNRSAFPWGTQWPPPAQVGNFADESARTKLPKGRAILSGYRDGYAHTSPVGSFLPNALGIHDLSGNVWEWVEDDYGGEPGNPASSWGVCRGGCWADGRRDELLTSMRNILKADYRGDGLYGFRIVLERLGADVSPQDTGTGADSILPDSQGGMP